MKCEVNDKKIETVAVLIKISEVCRNISRNDYEIPYRHTGF